jgi:hypothetical protein
VGKYAAFLGISLSALVFLAILAYNTLEIETRPEPFDPSPEAQANEYLALDRWLRGAGFPVRVENRGGPPLFKTAAERVVFVQASLFHWPADAWEQLEPWVEAGGALILSLDTRWYEREDEGPNGVLRALGIMEDTNTPWGRGYAAGEGPNFDRSVAFTLAETPEEHPAEPSPEIRALADHRGIIRLVRVNRGAGSVTVMGAPYFLRSNSLEKEANAALGWNLLAAGREPEEGGVLFIRGKTPGRSLFGRLADRGDFVPPAVSALALIAVGLWLVIPLFGVVPREDEKPGRPIRERFQAEGRFLKKYRSLASYRDAYVQEIFRRLRRRENLDGDEALGRRFAELWREAYASPAAAPPEPPVSGDPGRGDFVKTVNTLAAMLERL